MKLLLSILLAVFSIEADLQQLDNELSRIATYDACHEHVIDSLRQSAQAGDSTFGTYLQLFECYASYQFDSAYHYACVLERAASKKDINEQTIAHIKKSFVYFSAGLFKESHDELKTITRIESCRKDVQAAYYAHYARLYLDLATYASGHFYGEYTQKGIQLIEKQLDCLTVADTYQYYYALALRTMKQDNFAYAIRYFETALTAPDITDHEQAFAYSSMAYPASQLGDDDLALHCMILAAIYDIRSSTNEAVALRFVASMLHERGESDLAFHYIQLAKDDAEQYGARHRQMEVSQIMPIIEHEFLRREQQYHHTVHIITIIGTVLGLIVLGILLASYLYLRRKNRALSEARDAIHKMNNELRELGEIKEEYIGNFLTSQSDAIHQVDSTLGHLSRLSRERDLKGLVAYIDSLPRTNRRQQFMQQFDRMFLSIHPDFVERFNALLLPEYRIIPREGELLTTELRIFALMRLGITTNEKIAQVLDYSVNTVYTYKTKMRNRSHLSGEEFYAAAAKC